MQLNLEGVSSSRISARLQLYLGLAQEKEESVNWDQSNCQVIDDFESLDDNSSHIPISLSQNTHMTLTYRSDFSKVATPRKQAYMKQNGTEILETDSNGDSIKEIKVYSMKPQEMQRMPFKDFQMRLEANHTEDVTGLQAIQETRSPEGST